MPTMTSNRPFLSNFFAAFRTHSPTFPKATTSVSASATQTVWSSTASIPSPTAPQGPAQSSSQPATVSSPRTINAKSSTYAATPASPPQQSQPLQHTVSPLTHLPHSPSSPPVYGPPNKPQPSYPTPQEARRARRGSDSSSDGGFGDVSTGRGEKWYIGGRTAQGEERFYKLSVVKRDRSIDRLSADRLSL
ncbi:hypothetical protein H2203_009056 [Taxawa tesnikishii (nom. ined.)]|nr:hypothetical protein H2203_009056 [Dothideales sp. JES 119]